MLSSTNPTNLVIDGIGVMPYSARGLSQSIDPIAEAIHLERSDNGEFLDFSYSAFHKYKSTITGSDQRPPSVSGKWPGKLVVVECIATLSHPEYEEFDREPVNYDDAIVYEAGFVIYRPRLTMLVMNFSYEENEFGAVVGWTLELEEV